MIKQKASLLEVEDKEEEEEEKEEGAQEEGEEAPTKEERMNASLENGVEIVKVVVTMKMIFGSKGNQSATIAASLDT